MRYALAAIALSALASVGAAAWLLDPAAAALFAFATGMVMLFGSLPVVFSAWTRRGRRRGRRIPDGAVVIRWEAPAEEREVPGLADGSGGVPAPGSGAPSPPRHRRRPGHRRRRSR